MTMTYMMNASRFGGVPYSASPKVFLDVSKDIKSDIARMRLLIKKRVWR